MDKHDVCKYCEQVSFKCPCDKVDKFFSDNWDLMYVWRGQAEYKYAYAIPKDARKTTGGSSKSDPERRKKAA